MFRKSRSVPPSSPPPKRRTNRRHAPEVARLEERRLLSTADLITTATVTTITAGVAAVQPIQSAYATNASAVKVDFATSDPDDSGPAPTTHFNVTDVTTGSVVISNGTGNSLTLSQPDVYQVEFWSADSDDSEAIAAHSIMVAIDRTAPTIAINTVSPNVLWPPNGKFVTVTVTGVASDTLSGVNASSLAFHVIDEYGTVEPSGPITSISPTGPNAFGGDAQVAYTFQVMLQARRHGSDRDGRQYTIDVIVSDMAGNASLHTAAVVVPHDRRRIHGFHGTGDTGSSTSGSAKHNGHGHHGQGGQGAGIGQGNGSVDGNGNAHQHRNGHGRGNTKGHSHGNGSGHGNGNGQKHG
jgi:hypothetical protein